MHLSQLHELYALELNITDHCCKVSEYLGAQTGEQCADMYTLVGHHARNDDQPGEPVAEVEVCVVLLENKAILRYRESRFVQPHVLHRGVEGRENSGDRADLGARCNANYSEREVGRAEERECVVACRRRVGLVAEVYVSTGQGVGHEAGLRIGIIRQEDYEANALCSHLAHPWTRQVCLREGCSQYFGSLTTIGRKSSDVCCQRAVRVFAHEQEMRTREAP